MSAYETITLVAVAQYRKGYDEALDAARTAIAALISDPVCASDDHDDTGWGCCGDFRLALAVIDALRTTR